jgi:uncharacterized protein (TIGR03435 family)
MTNWKSRLSFPTLAALVLAALASPHAQDAIRFEVASVKPNLSGPQSRSTIQTVGDRFTVVNQPLRRVMQIAYGMDAERIVEGPAWLDSERFDIIAKADAPIQNILRARPMLRTLLQERFGVVTHTEQRATPVYLLVLARSDGRLGPDLRPTSTSCAMLLASMPPTQQRDPCGVQGSQALTRGRLAWRGFPLEEYASIFKVDAGRPVLNRTGLTGLFDGELNWTLQIFLRSDVPRERFPDVDFTGPSIFTALPEQWGLKLEARNEPIDILVVDHVDHPSPD